MNKFKVFHEYLGKEGAEVEAWDHAEAAENWVEENESNNSEYPLLDRPGSAYEAVEVEDKNGIRTKWRVYGESRPHYFARQDV